MTKDTWENSENILYLAEKGEAKLDPQEQIVSVGTTFMFDHLFRFSEIFSELNKI